MSFLNNSLKNAQQTRSTDRVPAGCPPYLQMDFHASNRSNLLLVAVMAAMMLFTAFMIRAWYRSGHIELKARAHTPDAAASPVSGLQAASQPAPAPVIAEEPKPAGVSTNAVTEEKSSAETTANIAKTAETPKAEPTVYKLQGIVFEPGHSSAVINGRTVVEGERVDNARVLSIAKDSAVILTAKGETMVLDLQ
jgi:cell division septation protein DedD